MAVHLRVLPRYVPVRHLALVDNIDSGESIVAAAKKAQASALEVAEELGVNLTVVPPKRAPRKRAPNRNGPVIASRRTCSWDDVNKPTQLEALKLAEGNILRCVPINENTVVITNHPGERPR